MSNWNVYCAPIVTFIWVMTPRVPGGVMRFGVMDDFGNLVTISMEAASNSLKD